MPRTLAPVAASAAAIGAGVIWSFGAVHVREADSDAFQYLIWRSIAIVVVVEIIAAARRTPSPTRIALTGGWLMWLANVSLLVASIAFVYAVDVNGAAQSAFLGSTTPLMAVAIGWLVLRERPGPITTLAVVLGFAGLLVMVWGEWAGDDWVGNASAVASSFGFAVYTACVRADRRRDWSPVLPGYAVVMIVLCTTVTLGRGNSVAPGVQPIVLAMIHGAVYIVVGTLLFNLASRSVPAVAMTVFAQAEMVFVPIWGVALLSESITARTAIGAAIVFAAIIANAVWGDHRTPTPTPTAPLTAADDADIAPDVGFTAR